MKVLEINGFRRWAEDYEGGHEVVRWNQRGRGVQGDAGPGPPSVLLQGLRWLRRLQDEVPDLIVCQAFGGSYRGRTIRRWTKYGYERTLIEMVGRMVANSGVPLAVVDMSDDISIHPVNARLLELATCYFKRELPLDPFHALESFRACGARSVTLADRKRDSWRRCIGKLWPLPLGCRQAEPGGNRVRMSEKEWDVFYAGSDVCRPRRAGIVDALDEVEKDGFRVLRPRQALPFEEYVEALRTSRLVLSPPGLGWDCHRHYEAAMVGSVPMMPFPTIQQAEPLVDGTHCLYCDPAIDLASQIRRALADGERLDRIAAFGMTWARDRHTHRAHFERVITVTTSEGGR